MANIQKKMECHYWKYAHCENIRVYYVNSGMHFIILIKFPLGEWNHSIAAASSFVIFVFTFLLATALNAGKTWNRTEVFRSTNYLNNYDELLKVFERSFTTRKCNISVIKSSFGEYKTWRTDNACPYSSNSICHSIK